MRVLVHVNWFKNLYLLLYTLMLFCAIGQFLAVAEYFIVGLDHISCVYSPGVGMEIASSSYCYKSCGCGHLWKYLPVALRWGASLGIQSGIMPKCAFHFPKFYQILSRKAPVVHEYFYFSNILFCWLPNFCLSYHSKVILIDDFWVWAIIISFLDPLWVAYSYFCLYYTGLLIFFGWFMEISYISR